MSWFVEHWIASSVLAVYVAVLFYNAYLGNKAATGMGGYYVGNREMGGAVVGISFSQPLPRPTRLLVTQAKAMSMASLGSPLPCFWLASLGSLGDG